MPDTPLRYQAQGRNKRTIVALVVAVAVLVGLYSVGTVTWVLVVLALFAVPAVFDVLRNPTATFEITDKHIEWKSPTQHARVLISQLQNARFDTRWDFSVRVTLTLVDQSKMRIPQDVLPPHQQVEDALKARGLKTERHHFRVV